MTRDCGPLGREGERCEHSAVPGSHCTCARSAALCEWPGVFWD
ncbi:unnamed protein product, partial [Staurois parvus]